LVERLAREDNGDEEVMMEGKSVGKRSKPGEAGGWLKKRNE
jgi:hypothetical protein